MKSLAILLTATLGLGCRTQDAPPSDAAPAASATPTPSEALDQLDQRRPVPLLPMMAQHQKENMREHLEAVQQIVAAAAMNDFDQVAVAAKRMGYSETMARMCQHMGAGAAGFTERALAFHHAADDIAVAATRHDGPAVLAALSQTLTACTSCHATFKQQPVASLPE